MKHIGDKTWKMIPRTRTSVFYFFSMSHTVCFPNNTTGAHQPSLDRLNEVIQGFFWPRSGRLSSLSVSDGVTGQERVVMVWPDGFLDGVCRLCSNSQLWLLAGTAGSVSSREPWRAALLSLLLPYRCVRFLFFLPCHMFPSLLASLPPFMTHSSSYWHILVSTGNITTVQNFSFIYLFFFS